MPQGLKIFRTIRKTGAFPNATLCLVGALENRCSLPTDWPRARRMQSCRYRASDLPSNCRTRGAASQVWALQAHDIKNLAASLSLVADELCAAPDDRTRTLGERIARACGRIVETCGRGAISPGNDMDQSLRGVIHDVCDIAQAAAHRQTQVSWECTDEINLGNRSRAIFRILANLVTNAVIALNRSHGGCISVSSLCISKRVLITVEDTGTGVQPSEHSQSGGLGLLIADALAQEIGVTLERVRYAADGTVYLLDVPLDQEERGGNTWLAARRCHSSEIGDNGSHALLRSQQSSSRRPR